MDRAGRGAGRHRPVVATARPGRPGWSTRRARGGRGRVLRAGRGRAEVVSVLPGGGVLFLVGGGGGIGGRVSLWALGWGHPRHAGAGGGGGRHQLRPRPSGPGPGRLGGTDRRRTSREEKSGMRPSCPSRLPPPPRPPRQRRVALLIDAAAHPMLEMAAARFLLIALDEMPRRGDRGPAGPGRARRSRRPGPGDTCGEPFRRTSRWRPPRRHVHDKAGQVRRLVLDCTQDNGTLEMARLGSRVNILGQCRSARHLTAESSVQLILPHS